MAMPEHLVLVRHGESEGNVAHRFSRQGDDRWMTPEFKARHSSQYRLTQRGWEQARAAGEWIRANIAEHFDAYYTSEYLRAMETSHGLNFPGVEWEASKYLREREMGRFDALSFTEREERYREAVADRERDAYYWVPPDGESMAALCLRMEKVLDTLHRETAGQRVLIVAHGDVIRALRVCIERVPQHLYTQLEDVPNCSVWHYARRDPETEKLAPYLNWLRIAHPAGPDPEMPAVWRPIVRPKYSNEDLRQIYESVPRIVEG